MIVEGVTLKRYISLVVVLGGGRLVVVVGGGGGLVVGGGGGGLVVVGLVVVGGGLLLRLFLFFLLRFGLFFRSSLSFFLASKLPTTLSWLAVPSPNLDETRRTSGYRLRNCSMDNPACLLLPLLSCSALSDSSSEKICWGTNLLGGKVSG